jgi:hypothetical protein
MVDNTMHSRNSTSLFGKMASQIRDAVLTAVFFLAVLGVATFTTGAIGLMAAPLASDPPLMAPSATSALPSSDKAEDEFATP